MTDPSGVTVNGSCAPAFERVRDAFEKNFTDGDEVGAAVAVWVDGDLVVNLWGGYADARRRTALAAEHPGQHLLRDQGPDEHLRAPAGRPRRDRPARPGRRVLAGVRPERKAGHHRRLGAGPPLRGDRPAHPHALARHHRLGPGVRRPGRRRAVVAAGDGAGLPHGDLRLHPRRGGPPRHRAHDRPVPADRDRPADGHRRAHRPAGGRTPPLRGDGQQAAHPRRAGPRPGAGPSGLPR